jgi:hypothetical protein
MRDDTSDAASLVDLVKAHDQAGVSAALAGGADVGARDGDDWNALDWAAGTGDAAIIQLLLDNGADPCATGQEQRTPYQIALSAGHIEAARLLRTVEEAADPASADRHSWRPYCKAYLLGDLRRFPGWRQIALEGADGELTDDSVVFIHDDLTATGSMWRGEDVLVEAPTEAWTRFCHEDLGFRVPDDFDLVPEGQQPVP